MIPYINENLFKQNSVKKNIIISDGDSIELTNEDLYLENFELTEMLCSENDLVYGSCNSACLKFTTSYLGSLKGKVLSVSLVLDEDEENPFQFGYYKVVEDKLTADRTKKEVVAYDSLYDIINSNVIDWYNTLLPNATSHVTLKQFRDSFFSHLSITQETITLENDSVNIYKTTSGEILSGADVIKAICEMNGCFGRINRSGNFTYSYLEEVGEGLFPAEDLYPANDLYPIGYGGSEVGENGTYISLKYEDYYTTAIDKLVIRDSKNDVGVTYGSGDNTYIIDSNFLLWGKGSSELTQIAQKIYNRISIPIYVPCEIEAQGNPCLEIGDGIFLHTTDGTVIPTYILSRVYKGIQAQKDTYTANGLEERVEQVNSLSSQLNQLRGKSNKLEISIEETRSTITDEILDPDNPQSLQSQITQNATDITAKVSKTSPTGQTSFSWNMSDSQMEWKANNSQIMLLNSSGLKITGEVNATTGSIAGWTITSSGITKTNGSNTITIQSDGTIVNQVGDTIKYALQYDGNAQFNGNIWITGNATINGYATAASVTAVDAKFSNLNASNITSGTLSADRISAGSITGSKLAAGTISGDKISADAFSGNTFTGSSFNVGTLSSTNGFVWLSGFKYTPVQYNNDLYLLRRTST